MSGPIGTEGLALFDTMRRGPTPPSVPCPTSEAAARAAETTGKAARQRDAILAYLRGRPEGATAGEIEAALGYSGTRARLLELSHGIGSSPGLGLIRRTEETRTVPGHRAALVWRIAEEGR